jgi:hypothetical protein
MEAQGAAGEFLVSLYSLDKICFYFFNISRLDFFFTRWDNIGRGKNGPLA